MIEIILFLVAGSIIYSVMQSIRRGDVSPEERKLNPTLIEAASEWADEVARSASKLRSQTEFELGYCGWFKQFEKTVSTALELAERKAEIESRLSGDPELRKIFETISADCTTKTKETDSQVDPKIDSTWAHEGPPPEPPHNSDRELDALYKRIYRECCERHNQFVQDTREKLKRNRDCREYFTKLLRDWDLRLILSGYFLNGEPLRRIVSEASGTSTARDIAFEALCMARSVDDPVQRTRALLQVAEGQAQIGDTSSARGTISEALQAAHEVPSERVSQLVSIGKAQASLGDVAGALETAQCIAESSSRGTVLVDISRAQISLGDATGAHITALAALDEARKIVRAEARCRVLQAVAKALAKAADAPKAKIAIDEALSATQEIEEFQRRLVLGMRRPARAEAMTAVAEVQVAIREFSGAVNTARRIQDQNLSQKALVKLVKALAETGEVSLAREITDNIIEADQRCWALAHVATAQARTGDLSGVIDTASEALESAKEIGDRSHSLRALVEIIVARAKAGDVPGALKSAHSIQGAEARCRALASVSFEQVRTKDLLGAKRTAGEALVAAHNVDPIDSIPGALGQVARAHAEAGDLPKALQIVRTIRSPAHRAHVLTEIARIRIKDGDRTEAKSAIFEALEAARCPYGEFNYLRTESCCRIAELQVMAGDANALQTALSAGNAVQVAYALERVAKASAEAGLLAQAVEIALGIEDVDKRSSATISVAVAYNNRITNPTIASDEPAEPTDRLPQRKPAEPSPSSATSERKYRSGAMSSGHTSIHQTEKDAIARIVGHRNIQNLIHFTQAENLSSIFNEGIVSVEQAQLRGIDIRRNDNYRFDGYLNAVSLSISYPNAKMFYKLRQLDENLRWVLLLVNPAVLWEKRCGFCRYNAADKRIPKRNEDALAGRQRFSEMFDRSLTSEDRHLLRPCDPTDPQAEVLVFEPIEFTYVDNVVFFDRKDMDAYGDFIPGAERTVDASWLSSRQFFLSNQSRSLVAEGQNASISILDDEIPF